MATEGEDGVGRTQWCGQDHPALDSARRIRIGRGKDRMGTGYPIGSSGKRPTREETVLELATAVSPELKEALATLRAQPDPDSPNGRGSGRFAELDGFSMEAKAKKVLSGLAFRQDDFLQPARTSAEAGLCALPCPPSGDGTRPADAGRTHQPPRPRNPGLVPGTGCNFPGSARPFPRPAFSIPSAPESLKSATAGSVAILGTSRVTLLKKRSGKPSTSPPIATSKGDRPPRGLHPPLPGQGIQSLPSPGPDQNPRAHGTNRSARGIRCHHCLQLSQPPEAVSGYTLGEVRQAYGDHLVYRI